MKPISKRLRITIQLLIVALCLAAVWWTVRKMGFQAVAEVALHAHLGWLCLSFVPIVLRFVVWSAKWQRMLRRTTDVSHGAVFRAVLAGAFINLVTPTAKLGGGIARALMIHKATGLRKSVAYGWSLADQLTNSLGNASLLAIIAIIGFTVMDDPQIGLTLLIIGFAAALVVYVFLRLRGFFWTTLQNATWLNRIRGWLPFGSSTEGSAKSGLAIRVMGPLLGPENTHGQIISDMALGSLSFASLCVANAMVFKALGSEASLLSITNGVILGYFAGTLVGTMGGIGATEFFLVQIYTAMGVEPTVAMAATLLHRASYYGATLLLGGAAVLMETGSSFDTNLEKDS